MSVPGSSLFDVFNARFLDPHDVGSTFVTSPFLSQVAAPVNVAVLGPRGSGKTTLLKMLTLPALKRWRGKERDELARGINYLAAYVPASITWNADYRIFSAKHIDQASFNLLSVGLFRHSVLLSFINTWQAAADPEIQSDPLLSRFYLPISTDDGPALCRHLADAWELDLTVSSVHGLRQSVRNRVRTIQRMAVRLAHGLANAKSMLEEAPFLTCHFIDDAVSFCDFLGEHYDFNLKLALCFDELEIAAAPISDSILQSPRSVDQRLLIKFSAAPFVPLSESFAERNAAKPTQQNDFDLVFMSTFSSRSARGFSENLFASICQRYGVEATAEQILGLSFLDDAPGDASDPNRYQSDGGHQRKFLSLYSKDKSFQNYMDSRQVDLADLTLGSEFERAASVRKILWPVLVREEFLFDDATEGARRRLRSKSAIADLYTGAGALFALCEGNPRWLLGLLEPMVEQFRVQGSGSIQRSLQKQAVERMIAAYFALLSTIPIKNEAQNLHSLVDLVDKIGTYFQRSVLGPEFNADPVLSFVVDKKVATPVKDLIGRGVNIGAFITEPHQKDRPYQVGEIDGLKIRLANIFAPRFRLPLAGGRSVNLSTVLGRRQPPDASTLEDLFGTKI